MFKSLLSMTTIDPSRFNSWLKKLIVLSTIIGFTCLPILQFPANLLLLASAPLVPILCAYLYLVVEVQRNREGIAREVIFLLTLLQFAFFTAGGHEAVLEAMSKMRETPYAAKLARITQRMLRLNPGRSLMDAMVSALHKLGGRVGEVYVYLTSIQKSYELGEDVLSKIDTYVRTLAERFVEVLKRRMDAVMDLGLGLFSSLLMISLTILAFSLSQNISMGSPSVGLSTPTMALAVVFVPMLIYLVVGSMASIPYVEYKWRGAPLIAFATSALLTLLNPLLGSLASLAAFIALRRKVKAEKEVEDKAVEFALDLTSNLRTLPLLSALHAVVVTKDYGTFNPIVRKVYELTKLGESFVYVVDKPTIPTLARIMLKILAHALRLGRPSPRLLDTLIVLIQRVREVKEVIKPQLNVLKSLVFLMVVMMVVVVAFLSSIASMSAILMGGAGSSAQTPPELMAMLSIHNIMASIVLSRFDSHLGYALFYLFALTLTTIGMLSAVPILLPQII